MGARQPFARLPRVAETNPQITAEGAPAVLGGTFPGDLGVRIVEVTDERAVGRLLVERRHLHPGAIVHGGVWVALADTVAAWGTYRHLPPGRSFSTVELKVNVLGAGRAGDELVATALPLHVGRSTQVWEVRVEIAGRLRAFFSCTQLVLAP